MVGIVISIIALLFSLFTYFKHDKKIKKQAALLNAYQLEKIDKEKKEEKRAIIEANVIAEKKDHKTIKIYNKGKCTAKNVNVIIPDVGGFHIFSNPCPIDIRPQNSIDIRIGVFTTNCPNSIDVQFEWSDDYKLSNKDNQMIQIS